MLKGALLGFGPEAAEIYAPALLDGASPFEIQAVACPDPQELEAASLKFKRARLYRDCEELLSKERRLHFALVALPAAERARGLLRALENGLHAASPPPFCFSVTEFDGLVRASMKTGKALFSAQPWERSASWSAMAKTINGGLLGEIRHAEERILTPRRIGPGRSAGITAALGWQAFSILLGIVRRPPTALAARLGAGPPYDPEAPEEEASFQIHFTGATGSIYLATGAHSTRFSAVAVGQKGMAELCGNKLLLDINGQDAQVIKFSENLAEGLARPRWFLRELEAFRGEIQKTVPDGSGLKNSLHCVKLLRNAYYSAAVNSAAVPL